MRMFFHNCICGIRVLQCEIPCHSLMCISNYFQNKWAASQFLNCLDSSLKESMPQPFLVFTSHETTSFHFLGSLSENSPKK